MSEVGDDQGAALPGPRTAGSLLREARQSRGMHIAALAATIKVTPRKLEALESDRYDELLDTTFTRALAQTVCRALKIDAEPVLALLPHSGEGRLQVGEGLNAPLRQHGSRREIGERPGLNHPAVWGAAVLVLGALAVYFVPSAWLGQRPEPGPAPAASSPAGAASAAVLPPVAPSAASSAGQAVAAPVVLATASPSASTSARVEVAPASASGDAPPVASAGHAAAGDALVVRALAGPSWLEVQDASGKMLIARRVGAGESVSLAGLAPLTVKIGNAAVTQVSFRGKPVPLARDRTTARFELK